MCLKLCEVLMHIPVPLAFSQKKVHLNIRLHA